MPEPAIDTFSPVAEMQALHAALSIIVFDLDGTILRANANILRLLGLSARHLIGRNEADVLQQDGAEREELWQALRRGEMQTRECRCTRNDGTQQMWLRVIYTPAKDVDDQPFEIVAFVSDVTAEKLVDADVRGQVRAINASHAVVHFNLDGTITDANEVFVRTMGYKLDEIVGRHHRMFVDPSHSHSCEYALFWNDLSEGRFKAGEFRRLGKGGREVWLQATYNPVFDLNGDPFKIVKYAAVVTREKLRQADHQGQIASIHQSQCVVSFDLDGFILDANDNFLEATGYRLAQVRGRHHRIFVDAEAAARQDYVDFWRDLSRGRHHAGQYKRITRDGREIWLQATYNPIFDMNGRPFKVTKYAVDVTQERLRQADYEGQIAAISKSQGVITFNMDGTIRDANDNFLRMMGYTLPEIVGRQHKMFVEPGVPTTQEYKAFWETLRLGKFMSARYKRIGKGGRTVWIQASYNPIFEPNGKLFKVMKLATDVTADVALAADLVSATKLAENDATTSLPNRLSLSRFLTAALKGPSADRVAVLYLDLDHFKPINDTYGHHVGDHVLKELACRLRSALTEDLMVGRMGGDEFIVIAQGLDDKQIESLAARLIAAVKAPIAFDKTTLDVGLSIGIAVSPRDGTTPEELLRCADVALYHSKGRGRGAYSFFTEKVSARVAADRHLAEELAHAIKANQFFLGYKPRFDVRSHRIIGVEVVPRWNHPERGSLELAAFQTVAEESGLAVPLGEWILRNACRAASAWPGIGVSVHISSKQFCGCDLPALVEKILRETGLEAARLELELSQASVRACEHRARATLAALKALGVRLAMVDFERATVSLDELRDMRIDVVKINRRFLGDIERRADGRQIIRAIGKLARTLGSAVTIDGIGAVEQLFILKVENRHEVRVVLRGNAISDLAIVSLAAKGTEPTEVPPRKLA